LTVPAFRRLWSAQLVSEVGDWSARLALSVLLYLRTGSPAVTGLVVTVSLLPWVGPGQLLTSFSERWPRRRVMVGADLVRAGAFVVVVVAPLPVPVLLAVVFCAGLATPPFEAARSALRPEVLPAGLFPSAVALSSVTQDLSAAVGYLTGGVLVGAFGAPAALLCNAGSFVVSALLLLGMPLAPAPRCRGSGGSLRASARALAGDPWIVRAVVLVTAAMLAATALSAMSAPLVLGLLGGAPGLVGMSVAAAAVVSIAATAAVPPHNSAPLLLRWAGMYTLAGGGGIVGCFTAVVLGAPRVALIVASYAAVGLLFAVIAPANVVVSPRLAGEVRASALSLLMGMLVATQAVAAAMAGFLADAVGLLPVCVALGVPPLVVGTWALLRPVRSPAEAVSDEGSVPSRRCTG
jgi:MFS family permease